jgi:dipeptidase D
MKTDILTLEPALLWKNFKQICNIPHPSKKEKQIVEWVHQFAKNNGLQYKTDVVGNTVIIKPATAGMENRKTIVLQAHLDMVPQKNMGITHDFEKDPILPYAVDGWVKATDTTLGADNGVGAAAMLSVLESKNLVHGTIEALFTIDEETGLTGAFGLKPGFINGNILLNTDTEDEGHFCIGCAGGINTNGVVKYKKEELKGEYTFNKVTIKGLKGGHSGADIHLYRGNAIKMMSKFLWNASRLAEIRIVSFDGGNVRNAIPRESFSCIAFPDKKENEFRAWIRKFTSDIKNEYSIAEPDFSIELEPAKSTTIIDSSSQQKLLNILNSLPNGVLRMSDEVKGIVETSTNLSIIRTHEGYFEIQSLTRSSLESAKQDVINIFQGIYEMAGKGTGAIHEGSYPGWKPNSHSPILEQMKSVYKRTFGNEPAIEVVHAGLECGIIGNIYPGMDMISFGPTIKYPHSPDEKVEIQSVKKFWELLLNILKEAPVK